MHRPELAEKGTVLCEWTSEEKGYGHANHGIEVLPAEAGAFSDAIARILKA